MNLGEQIRINRKKIGLTQEQVADYLGVSTPAVNKWERGTTCPDISLLPALARLLDIDMNELFSFREELTELEIGLFINELSETAQEISTDAAFTMAEKKLHEYPRCDSLRYHCALILNSVLTLNGFKDEQAKYEETILSWLTQAAESSDDRTRLSALCILASKYIQRNEHEKATMLLEQIPDITIDKALLKATILTRQESPDAAAAMPPRHAACARPACCASACRCCARRWSSPARDASRGTRPPARAGRRRASCSRAPASRAGRGSLRRGCAAAGSSCRRCCRSRP